MTLSSVAMAVSLPEFDCVIEPHIVTDISSQVDGIVAAIDVERGDLIEKGQVIVRLDSSVEQATVEYARKRAAAIAEIRANETSAEFSGRRHDRVGTLYKSNVLSFDQMDEVGTEARLAELQLARAQENRELAELDLVRAIKTLNRHTIVSPIDGVVVERFLSPGESVEEKPILRLAQIDPLRVEVIVPITHMRDIVIGQIGMIFPEEPITSPYPAEVTIVDRVADAASGTFRVRLTLPNPTYDLPAGLRCTVQFEERGPEPAVLAREIPSQPEPPAAPVAVVAKDRVGRSDQGAGMIKATTPGTRLRRAAVVPVATNLPTDLKAEAGKVDAGPNLCRTLGPIGTAEQAKALKDAITPQVLDVRLRQKSLETTKDYMILTDAAENLSDALKLADEIRDAGIADVAVFRRGKNALRVSVGYYSGLVGAERRRDRVVNLGFDAEVVPRFVRKDQFWLDIEAGPDSIRPDAMALVMDSIAADLESSSVQCDQFAAADE